MHYLLPRILSGRLLFLLNECDDYLKQQRSEQAKCMSFVVRQDDLLRNPVYKKLGAINAMLCNDALLQHCSMKINLSGEQVKIAQDTT